MYKEAELRVARRHIQEGDIRVRRQRSIVAELRRNGHPTIDAEDLLKTLEILVQSHRDHYELLLKEGPSNKA